MLRMSCQKIVCSFVFLFSSFRFRSVLLYRSCFFFSVVYSILFYLYISLGREKTKLFFFFFATLLCNFFFFVSIVISSMAAAVVNGKKSKTFLLVLRVFSSFSHAPFCFLLIFHEMRPRQKSD